MGNLVSERIRLVRPTRHCEQRMLEAKVGYKALVYYLLHGEYEKLPRELSQAKRVKYHGNSDVYYIRWGTYIFTCKNMKDTKGRDITRVITMVDQRITADRGISGAGTWIP